MKGTEFRREGLGWSIEGAMTDMPKAPRPERWEGVWGVGRPLPRIFFSIIS